jgi:CRISPR-associated protein Cmr6
MRECPNIGYMYYKDYYADLEEFIKNKKELKKEFKKALQNKNRELLNQKIDNQEEYKLESKYTFSLKTTYPGLLIGSGYTHGIKHEDDFKLGLSFDYTSGLPVISASSIKGLIRSAFKKNKEYKYIETLMKNKEINVEELEKEIFDGIIKKQDGEDVKLSVYKRDIFFDARLNVKKSDKDAFLKEDYITPHYKDVLKDPIPIKFIKVAPNMVFDFNFDLKENGSITVREKLELFRRIILDLGIGAKSNVGYGCFDEVYGKNDIKEMISREEEEKERRKLELMTDIEKELYCIDKLRDKDVFENKLNNELYKKLDTYGKEDKLKVAEYLKESWIYLEKWENGKIKKKFSPKQKDKIEKVKNILNDMK